MQDENIKIKVKTEGFEEATQEIDMLAEAYDVRCKDCKHADKYHHCERSLMWTTAEDY